MATPARVQAKAKARAKASSFVCCFGAWWIVLPALLVGYYYHIRYENIHAHVHNWREGQTRLRHNYDRSVFFSPSLSYHEPTSVDEIVSLVQQAVLHKHRIKVVGGGHSWSDIAQPTHIMVSLDRYSSLVSIDKHQRTITVQAGMRLYELQAVLVQHGLALPILPSVNEQSVAGAIATGTHGTGVRYGALHTCVLGVSLVTGVGTVLHINGTSHSDLLPAVRTHLGALGIITQVTLACVDTFNLHEVVQRETTLNWKQEDALSQLLKPNDHVKVWLFPCVPEHGIVYTYNRTLQAPRDNIPAWKRNIEMIGYEIIQNLSVLFPSWTSFLIGSVFRYAMYEMDHVDRWDLLFNVPASLPPHFELEYAVPAELALPLLRAFLPWSQQFPHANHAVELRWVGGDSVWLSHDYGQDMFHITLCWYGRNEQAKTEYFSSFERLVSSISPTVARPHWAKWFSLSSTQLSKLYPKYQQFKQIRQQLDPHGVFNNAYLDRVLGAHP